MNDEENEERSENSEWSAKFFQACFLGDEEEAAILIKRRCCINCQNDLNQTGLIVAAHQGHVNIVRLLLNNGADHDLVDAWGYNALMKAAACGHTSIFRLVLRKSNSLLCNTFMGKQTCLTEAATFGKTEIVKLCLEYDIQIIDTPVELSGMTPLMLAVLGGHYNAVEILLENGANMLLRNSSSQTAKEIALRLGDENLIKLIDSYSGSTSLKIPEIVISYKDNAHNFDSDIMQNKFNLTPTSRLPLRNAERQMRTSSIVRHIERRSKSCDNAKRKKSSSSKSEGLFHYILESDGLDKYWYIFKEQEIDLKIFFTLNEDDFQSIGIVDRDVLDKLLDLSFHYKPLFNV
uniref:Uncharacterized protein n=1 Tax=Lygus hesperus TaxID=30085 RepID=A0A0A9W135_LYGHE